MIKNFLILITIFSAINLKAQNSIYTKLRPSLEIGTNFLKNEQLKSIYKTNSMFFFSIGLQTKNVDEKGFTPFIQYSNSKINSPLDTTKNATEKQLKFNQFLAGGLLPIYKINNALFALKIGLSYSKIRENTFVIDDFVLGYLTGLRFEGKLLNKSKSYIECSYNYQKIRNFQISDFNVAKLSIGFIL